MTDYFVGNTIPVCGLDEPCLIISHELTTQFIPNRLISADEFESKICAETKLSIEDMTTVLRVLNSCQTVRKPDE